MFFQIHNTADKRRRRQENQAQLAGAFTFDEADQPVVIDDGDALDAATRREENHTPKVEAACEELL